MKRKNSSGLALALAIAVMLAAGAPAQASEIDDGIAVAFKQTYVYKVFLQNDAINVEAKEGFVTLTGTVAEEAHKMLAQELAASLPEVTGVDNQLATPSEIAAENADAWIVQKVKFALMFHRNVNASATAIEAQDGVVTLKGEATSLAQKELAGEYAKDIEGVNEVKNEMTVAATPEPAERTASEKIDDMSITAQVKAALLTHRSTGSIKTQVVTRNGEVSLTGIAKNDAEKSLVSKLVADINGVVSVKNEMTVADVVTQ